MFRNDDPTTVASLPAPAAVVQPGYFTDGNPGSGLPATIVQADWANGITEELLYILAQAGVTPNKSNNTQLLQALRLLFAGSSGSYQPILGFTPVQQGTGLRQEGNVVKIGYTTSSTVGVTIDSTDEGDIAFRAWVQSNFIGGIMKSGIGSAPASGTTVTTGAVSFSTAFPGGCTMAFAQPIGQANSTYGYLPTSSATAYNAAGLSARFDTLTGAGSTAAVNFDQTLYFNWAAWGF